MRPQVKPLLVALAFTLAGTGAAFAQAGRHAAQTDALESRTNDVLQSRNAASDDALSVSGSTTYTETYSRPDMGVSASPTDAVRNGAPEATPRRASRLRQLIDNGTAMASGQAGANALGNTGGMTTGPSGSAGIVAGGGAVHTATGVISPGPNNGRLSEDAPVRRTQLATSDDARERAARTARSTAEEEHGGLRNRMSRSDEAEERRARAALNDEPLPAREASDDARERASRAATRTEAEEHGGFWNGVRNFFHRDRD